MRGTEYGLCGRREWESLHPGVSCFVCKPRAEDQTPLWRRSPGYCPVGKKWSQGRGERSLLSLGLAVKPPIPAACTSVPAPSSPPQPRAGLQGCSILCLPQSFLQTLQRDFSPPLLIILSLTTSAPPAPPTSPASLCSSCQATCVTRARGKKEKKKVFENPLAREPRFYFWRALFFSFKTRKPQGKIGNSGAKGVCFSFSQACLLSCPANVTTTALWGKSAAQTREEKCFSCKTAAKTMGLHLSPLSLSNQPNLLPITRPSARLPDSTLFSFRVAPF